MVSNLRKAIGPCYGADKFVYCSYHIAAAPRPGCWHATRSAASGRRYRLLQPMVVVAGFVLARPAHAMLRFGVFGAGAFVGPVMNDAEVSELDRRYSTSYRKEYRILKCVASRPTASRGQGPGARGCQLLPL
jgi:hypothetical protein